MSIVLVVLLHDQPLCIGVFLHGLFSSNSTVKVMKGPPWRIGVAKDNATKRP